MDTASIISDLASPHLSMMEIAERHALTLSALAAFITSDQGQEQLEQLQSAAAIRTRLIAQLHLPLAAAALSAILQSHCAASFTAAPTRESVPSANTPQHTNPLDIAAREESPPGDHARHAAPPTPQELNQPHSSHDAATFPPASSHVSAPSVSSPTIDHARTLRHQIELRRAAATLLRFAAFNHGHLARAASDPPRNASSSHNPISPRANAPHEQPQHIAHTAAPSGITLDPSPATPAGGPDPLSCRAADRRFLRRSVRLASPHLPRGRVLPPARDIHQARKHATHATHADRPSNLGAVHARKRCKRGGLESVPRPSLVVDLL
ncbi:MAG: hypothetical protein KF864_00135 [Phycisphaeraceae bacterium]|nr:hypothetical protein [Phycisphaeraceae bacterium]